MKVGEIDRETREAFIFGLGRLCIRLDFAAEAADVEMLVHVMSVETILQRDGYSVPGR